MKILESDIRDKLKIKIISMICKIFVIKSVNFMSSIYQNRKGLKSTATAFEDSD